MQEVKYLKTILLPVLMKEVKDFQQLLILLVQLLRCPLMFSQAG